VGAFCRASPPTPSHARARARTRELLRSVRMASISMLRMAAQPRVCTRTHTMRVAGDVRAR
jgi:hypothetical protein